MSTCFLFLNQVTEEGYLSLSLDERGEIIAPLAKRQVDEVKAIQQHCRTIIILQSTLFTLHRVDLPLLGEKKAQAAIPFALEDKLAQNVNQLHFAFERRYYQDNQYLVVVGEKINIETLLANLREQEIDFNLLTIDWFALESQEIAILDSYLLINTLDFQGALKLDLANLYVATKDTEAPSIYSFQNSNEALTSLESTTKVNDNAYCWLAKRLQNKKPLNLCQGSFAKEGEFNKIKYWYLAALLMSLLWLVTFSGIHLAKLFALTKKNKVFDQEIAIIYHEFFSSCKTSY